MKRPGPLLFCITLAAIASLVDSFAFETLQRTSPQPHWLEFESLRELDLDDNILDPFFRKRPNLIFNRMYEVATTLYHAQADWKRNNDESDVGQKGAPGSIMDKEMTIEEKECAKELCRAVSSLGPVAVKLGQTLSQRPDLVGVQAAKALKTLQTQNQPFDNQLAYEVLHESLDYWDGPLAPGIPIVASNRTAKTINPDGPTLFAKMTVDPVACASLGQVYKATTHDGKEIAVKVQRPDALATLAKDLQCFRLLLQGKQVVEKVKTMSSPPVEGDGMTEEEVRQGVSTFDAVLDRVARDVKRELDYRQEAENSGRFRESLSFLGFVTTPKLVNVTDRVLITEWVPGRHLSDLTKEEGLAMTRMAVEACTASMVLTGFVHADPHEGNLMLHDDGRLVFLDFGLMSDVEDSTMEGFAKGIQALLAEDWAALTEAFVDIGFVIEPIMHRNGLNDLWRVEPDFGLPELAIDLEKAMKSTEGGTSRFGALATILNKKISPNWLVFTPPYVLLLIRTYLTLEGIAASVDPDFNIYEMAMPWAIQRTLSPSTIRGVEVFRSTILTSDNKLQWERFMELANPSGGKSPSSVISDTAEQTAMAKQAAMKDAVKSLLGSSSGRALRRILKDVDSVDMMRRLASSEARPLLRQAIEKSLTTSSKGKRVVKSALVERPVSTECQELRKQQKVRRRRAMRVLLMSHLSRCFLSWKGLMATVKLTSVSAKLYAVAFVQRFLKSTSREQSARARTLTE